MVDNILFGIAILLGLLAVAIFVSFIDTLVAGPKAFALDRKLHMRKAANRKREDDLQ